MVADSLNFQWLRDGAPIASATGTSYQLALDDIGALVSLSVNFVDGRAHPESLLLQLGERVGDRDGVPAAIELAVRGLQPQGQQGDGNGDGTLDAYQVNVVSAQVPGPGDADARYVTLVADSAAGRIDTADGNSAAITAASVDTVPGGAPANVRLQSTLDFTATVGAAGTVETFSMYFDASLAARGYWLQDGQGAWHNVTTALETHGGKTRIDFLVADGGPLDTDGVANGVISTHGVVADAAFSIVGSVPGLNPLTGVGAGDFWF